MTIRIADGQHMVESHYDKVFDQYTHQQDVFQFVHCKYSVTYFLIFVFSANIQDVLQGFNSTIFAYGQTGSGKTFTMFGPHWDDNTGYQNTLSPLINSNKFSQNHHDPFLRDQQQFGIIPRAIEALFEGLQVIQHENPTQSFTVYCSFLQIYNEKLFDLFQDRDSSKALNIREDKYTGIFVEGQSEYVVNNS